MAMNKTSNTTAMNAGIESRVKLPALSTRSIGPSGFFALRMAKGMAVAKARIWLMTMSSTSMGMAPFMVVQTEVSEIKEVPRLPWTIFLIQTKYCSSMGLSRPSCL